jgi:hypothetical protein
MERLPGGLRRRLTEAGYSLRLLDAAVGTLVDAQELLVALGYQPGDALAGQLLTVVVDARPQAALERRRSARAGPYAVSSLLHLQQASQVRVRLAELPPPVTSCPPDRRRWPTRFKQRMSSAVAEEQRLELERTEQDRWARELASIVEEAQLPAAEEASLASAPEAVMAVLGGSRRPSTLRMRVRTWRKIRFWLLQVSGTPWPAHVGQMLDYLQAAVAATCARTWPGQVAASLAFLETVGGVPEDRRISTRATWRALVADTEQRLQGGGRPAAKAPLLVRTVIVALELYVLGPHAIYKRAYAWVRLVKIWASLRTNDLQGLPPALLRRTSQGLSGTLMRTKTTGPGRKVKTLPIYVDAGCWLADARWLSVGAQIWESPDFSFGRDYFVPTPAKDYSRPVPKMADYMACAALGHALLADLRMPHRAPDGTWSESESRLALRGAHLFWTEHSERNYLSSIAAGFGVDKTQRDYLGRWQPSQGQSNDYVRTAQQVVTGLQRRIATHLREVENEPSEEMVMQDLATYLAARGASSQEVLDAVAAFTFRGGGVAVASAGLPVTPSLGSPPGGAESERSDSDVGDADVSRYWISVTRHRRFRRLHRYGGCHYTPGVSVRDWESYNTLDEADYDARCRLCWRLTSTAAIRDGDATSDGSSSSTSAGDKIHVP